MATHRSITPADDERRAIYQSYIEDCNAHNFEAMERYYTSPAININDDPWTPQQVTAQFKPLVDAFPDWHWDIRHLTIDGDYLSLHFDVSGTHKGTFQGIEATGRRVKCTQFTLYHLRGDKFADVWDLTDFSSILKQIS
jgi:predicted ester cyclase